MKNKPSWQPACKFYFNGIQLKTLKSGLWDERQLDRLLNARASLPAKRGTKRKHKN
jgi:hypothetical protein